MLFSFYVMSFEEPCYAALLNLMASIVHTGYSQRFQHMNTWDHIVTSAIVMSLRSTTVVLWGRFGGAKPPVPPPR